MARGAVGVSAGRSVGRVVRGLRISDASRSVDAGDVGDRRIGGATPWRCTAAAVTTILAYLLGWVVALVLGFFVTGVVAAFLTWLWFGANAAALLVYWSALYRKGVGI